MIAVVSRRKNDVQCGQGGGSTHRHEARHRAAQVTEGRAPNHKLSSGFPALLQLLEAQ